MNIFLVMYRRFTVYYFQRFVVILDNYRSPLCIYQSNRYSTRTTECFLHLVVFEVCACECSAMKIENRSLVSMLYAVIMHKGNAGRKPTLYPGSLPTPNASEKTLVGVGHVNPRFLGVNQITAFFMGGVVEWRDHEETFAPGIFLYA